MSGSDAAASAPACVDTVSTLVKEKDDEFKSRPATTQYFDMTNGDDCSDLNDLQLGIDESPAIRSPPAPIEKLPFRWLPSVGPLLPRPRPASDPRSGPEAVDHIPDLCGEWRDLYGNLYTIESWRKLKIWEDGEWRVELSLSSPIRKQYQTEYDPGNGHLLWSDDTWQRV